MKTGAGTFVIWAAACLECVATGFAAMGFICKCFLNCQDLYCYDTY
jgi:hypothetical protein